MTDGCLEYFIKGCMWTLIIAACFLFPPLVIVAIILLIIMLVF
jgi:hypothetical protein